MRNKSASIVFVLSTLIYFSVLSAANARNVSNQDLQIMEQKVAAQSMEHKKLQAKASQINMELTTISQQMIKAARLIQNNEEKLSSMESNLEKLKNDLAENQKGFIAEDENLIRTISALQSLALKPTEALFVQPLTPVDIIRSAILLRESVPYLEENANRIRKKLERIESQKKKIEKQFARIKKQKKSLEYKHSKMKILVQKKSRIRNAVEIKSVQTKRNADKLASQAKSIRDLLGKIETRRQEKIRRQEAERKRLALIKAKEKKLAYEAQREQDLIKAQMDSIKNAEKNFVKAKGTLSMPARGQIVTAFGQETSKGVSSKGLSIKTRKQAQVISPFDGSVVFSGPFRGYGNLIIIEHGQGYLSLLAGLDIMDVEVGQMLLAGEPVGQMPDDEHARLYVELRRNNHPINPKAWMAN